LRGDMLLVNEIAGRTEYVEWFTAIKGQVQQARLRAVISVNRELVLLYWRIGQSILKEQSVGGWGAGVIDRLAHDLRMEFPDMKGFSPRNLKYMRAFAEAYPDEEFVQEVLAQISWYHNLALIEKTKDRAARQWYARASTKNGWSRNILVMQIESRLYERQAVSEKTDNFESQLPPLQSDLVRQALKDPYIFDFLSLSDDAQEREIEKGLTDHITRFLLELGAGFSFVGRQYHLEIGDEDFYIDLLFYHLNLRCYVVIELKASRFKPEYAGKLNFYLSAVDAELRHPTDNPSIGLILCKDKNKLVAEYSLKDVSKPIGIAEYELVQAIPEHLKTSLPTIEELEAELATENDGDDE
jgi:predicted nuclease of restriction endonuclease-like (RecB) superfamily